MIQFNFKGTAILLVGAAAVGALIGGLDHPVRSEDTPTPPPRSSTGDLELLPKRGTGDGGESAAAINLEALLRKLSNARTDTERKKLLDEAKPHREEFRGELPNVLGNPSHPYIVAAIELTQALHLDTLVQRISHLASAGGPQARAAAIVAVSELDEWWPTDIARFLREYDDAPTLIAALRVAATMKDRPFEPILALLGHGSADVRIAAAYAMPKLGPGRKLDQVIRRTGSNDVMTAIAATHALSRVGISVPVENRLYDLIEHSDWRVVQAALMSLESKRAPLNQPFRIIQLLREPGSGGTVAQVAALIALEHTKTIPERELAALLPELHPVAKLMAARCLVTAGNSRGVNTLIELLRTKATDLVDDEARDCAIEGALAVLRELSGQDYGRDQDAWRKWARLGDHLRKVSLSTAPPRTW